MRKEEFIAHGYMCLSNYGGVEIMLSDDGESVIYSWYGKIARRWQQIKYTLRGRAFFTINGRRFHLDEFLRTNI